MDVRTNYADLFYRETDSLSILEQNVKDFPASAIARFSLLYHYKKNNNPQFENFADQTSLYFNNSYWLREQLSQAGSKREQPAEFAGESSNRHPEYCSENDLPDAATIEEVEQQRENIAIVDENLPILVNEEFAGSHNSAFNDFATDIDEKIITSNDNDRADFSVNPGGVVTVMGDEFSSEVSTLTDTANGPENHPGNMVSDDNGESALSNEVEDFPVENNISINETVLEISEIGEQTPDLQDLAGSSTSGEDPEETIAAVKIAENELVEEDLVAFEPLHTIDYFASQGIKIKEEALMNDKLGQQVKSFTAWLKSMKKLHPGKLPEQNEVIERIIQSSAEQSNADAEVLTEAMAEVLIKQNKVEKAVEMYQKLSLINPSKSTYFAAKIESLKTN